MKVRSPLMAIVVVSLCLAGVLPPSVLRFGAALSEPSLIASFPTQPGTNPTVIVDRTWIDFRLYPMGTNPNVVYYICDTATGSRVLQDDDQPNSMLDERYASVILDVWGDPSEREIITVTPNNNLRCLARDGTQVWNRPYGIYDQLGCPALYDLDNDGKYEVILGLHGGTSDSSSLLVINAEDGTENRSVPLGTGVRPFSAPVVGDVDNDGEPEIVCVGENGRVFCLTATGSTEWQASLPYGAWASPIMGDFDADGQVEVIVVTTNPAYAYYLSGKNGSLKRTINTGLTAKASPVAADVNNDGYLEIIVTGLGTAVKAIDRYGNMKSWSNSPASQVLATPAVVDTDGNGIPEVVVADSRICVFDWSGLIYYRSAGAGWSNNGNSPVVFDSNSDGILDIVYLMTTGTDTQLYRVTTTTPSSQKKWVTFKNDFRRSGVYGSDLYGVDPDLTINNQNWSYGSISKGSVAYKDYRVTNVGKATLTGNCWGQAKITINDTSPFSLAPGLSRGFRAYFDTSSQGIQTGFLLIGTNDPDEPKLNITCTANVTQPLHDIAAYAVHVASQLNPNYVNDPPVKVEYRNLGSFRETGITANLTINGVLCANLTPRTFSLNPGQAFNVTFYWDRTVLGGEGTFLLRGAAQNANITLEANQLNNVITKTVEVKYPLRVLSVTTSRALNLTNYTPTDTFTEGDYMGVKAVIQNQWSVPVTFIPVFKVEDVTGAPVPAYGGAAELTLAGGAQATLQSNWYLGLDIATQTKYNATVYAFDRLGGGVKILALPYVHTFWVQPS